MSRPWDIRLTATAERDLDDAVRSSVRSFGIVQARAYETLIVDALAGLHAGPQVARSIARDDLGPGYRSLHVARRGRSGRHRPIYRVAGPMLIEVVRILHDRMDVVRHIPKF